MVGKAHAVILMASPDRAGPMPCPPAHGIPDIARKTAEIHGRGNWYRIFGLFHMLSTAEDDGPVSRIRY